MLSAYEFQKICELLERIGVGAERIANAEERRNELLQRDADARAAMFKADQLAQQQRWAELTTLPAEVPFAPTDGG